MEGRLNQRSLANMTIFSNLFRVFKVPSDAERERSYLEGASDLLDLEHRQREIDRGRLRARELPYY